MKRIRQVLSAVGPGIFAIGYTIGTGSVTSMAKAGADYGLGLLWVLALSCLFSGVLMTAYGRFAVVFFMVGTLAAGLSSVFPILMVAPLLVGDWRDGQMETKTPLFRIVCLVAAAWGLVVPALGGDPVAVTIAAQISNVFVLPLTVAAIICLVNRKTVMGAHRASVGLNALLAAAFVFSVAVTLTGVKALAGMVLK